METTHTFRKAALRLLALPLAFAPLTGALADDSTAAEPVEKLKASLQSTVGFEVDDVKMNDGVACITYRVSNDTGGESRAQAVVDGDKVLRSTTRSTKFAKAWNSKCAASRGGGA